MSELTFSEQQGNFMSAFGQSVIISLTTSEMCSERDSPLEPFVLPAPGQPELARLICGAHLSPPVLTRKQKRPRVNSLVCDRAAALYAAGPPEALSRMSRLVTQAAERERELARARSQRLKQAARSLPGESVSRGFAGRGALEGYPSHYTSLTTCNTEFIIILWQSPIFWQHRICSRYRYSHYILCRASNSLSISWAIGQFYQPASFWYQWWII